MERSEGLLFSWWAAVALHEWHFSWKWNDSLARRWAKMGMRQQWQDVKRKWNVRGQIRYSGSDPSDQASEFWHAFVFCLFISACDPAFNLHLLQRLLQCRRACVELVMSQRRCRLRRLVPLDKVGAPWHSTSVNWWKINVFDTSKPLQRE